MFLKTTQTAARMARAFPELIEKGSRLYYGKGDLQKGGCQPLHLLYLHYETVGDLLAESAQHIIDKLVACMPYNTAEFLSRLPEPPLSELYSVTPEHLTPYLTYIKEHRRIFRATVEQVTVLQVNDACRDLNRYVFTPILKLYQVSEADREYVLQFFIGGLMAVNRKWLQEDCRDSIEHVIAVTQHCIRHA